MNPTAYRWTGTSALENRYPITEAISHEVLIQDLVDYDLIIFDAAGLLLETTPPGPLSVNSAQQWRLRPGVEAWFQANDWTSRKQAPYLALISTLADLNCMEALTTPKER